MIGYYVHHHGAGHLHRAGAIATHLHERVTGLSSLSPPDGWPGPWVDLPLDSDLSSPGDPTAQDRLHWVPERSEGLLRRMAHISAWLESARPTLVVVDVSVEVALLCRLHGIPVVTMVLPGDRGDDAHCLVHTVARRVIAPWPAEAEAMIAGLPPGVTVDHVGAFSRFDGRATAAASSSQQPRATLLLGRGGTDLSTVAELVGTCPDWSWTMMGGPGPASGWVEDPWSALTAADVIVTHAGLNALAEVAAARRPAIVLPQNRPHSEQHTTAAALARGRWPVVSRPTWDTATFGSALEAAAALDGSDWSGWNDGSGARRAAELIDDEAAR